MARIIGTVALDTARGTHTVLMGCQAAGIIVTFTAMGVSIQTTSVGICIAAATVNMPLPAADKSTTIRM